MKTMAPLQPSSQHLVEPPCLMGRRQVELVEIPTDDEIYDNIVAYWTPRTRARGSGMSMITACTGCQ